MITNDSELELVRTQLGRVHVMLDELERTIRPFSEARYHLWSETTIDMQRSLQADIDDYLRRKAHPAESSSNSTAPRLPFLDSTGCN